MSAFTIEKMGGATLTQEELMAARKVLSEKQKYLMVVPLWKAIWLKLRHWKSVKILGGGKI